MSLSVANFIIDNASGQAVRQDIEACLLALQGLSAESGSDLAESKCVQGMWFLRSDTKEVKIKKSTLGFTTVGNIDQPNLGLLPRSGGTSAPMTGQFLANSGGLASAPDIAFDGDIDTGLYRVSSDILGVSCGGTDVFEFRNGLNISRKDFTISKNDNLDAILNIVTNSDSKAAYIDLVTSNLSTNAVGHDFGLRLFREAGVDGNSLLHHRSDSNTAQNLVINSQTGSSGGILFQTGGTPNSNLQLEKSSLTQWSISAVGALNSNSKQISNSLTTAGASFHVQQYYDAQGNIQNYFDGLALVKNNNGWGTPLFINRLNPYATGNLVEFQSNNTFCGSINTTTGSTTNFNTNVSDRTLKKNFENWNENTLDLFKSLNPQKYNYLHQEDTAQKDKGFIAQEVVDSFPEAYPQNDEGKYMFNPSGMVVYLMKALQEAVAKIETLEAKVAALEA